MTQVKGPSAPAQPPPQTPAQPTRAPGNTGALGLGVDVGVVLDPTAGTAFETPAHEVDRYDTTPRPTDEAREEDAPPKSGEDPFKNLRRDRTDGPRRRASGKPVGVDKEIDVDPALLGKLAGAEGKLGPDHAGMFDKIRQGMMLLGADAQQTAQGKLQMDGTKLESVAQKIFQNNMQALRADAKSFARLYARFLAGGKANVQAFVQRVLRESYLIQNELLHDYAAKVKHFNELKKATRGQLEKARSRKSQWVSEKQAEGKAADDHWISDSWFEWIEIDDNGQPVPVLMTEEDVASWRRVDEAARSGGSEGAAGAYDSLYGESRLTADDIDVLKELKKDRGIPLLHTGSDNYICDHMDDLLPLIPKMNGKDIDKYLLPIIEHLNGGNADEEEMLEIYRTLSPAQFVYTASGGLDPSDLGQRSREAWTTIGAVAGTVAGAGVFSTITAPLGALAGAAFGVFFGGPFNDAEMSEFKLMARKAARGVAEGLGVEFSGDLSQQKAANLIAAVIGKHEAEERGELAPDANPGETPSVGDPKMIRTIDEMEAYIKNMEDKLSSIGDDAQLANVDLQNALQTQQQTLQMMSNISKILHDTAMAIVRKAGQ
jgi:hypothetical protein